MAKLLFCCHRRRFPYYYLLPILQASLFPVNETGTNLDPLLFRYGFQMERTRRASLTARTTSDAFVPVINRLAIRGPIQGVRKELATPDALPAGITFFVVFDNTIVRSLDRFLQTSQTPCIQYRAATTAAVTAADELRSCCSHGEPIERLHHHGPHVIKFIPELRCFLPGEHVF